MIAASVSVGESTVYRTKRRFVEGSLDLALSKEQRPHCGRKLSAKEEALLIATACSGPPEGVFLDAHRPWRTVKVTERRTAVDFAQCMRDLVDIHYPSADVVRVVMDNLSTHGPGALYEASPAPEAHRILKRLEIHYTPKHASWLNMVELEIGVLRGQCLDRRIGERTKLTSEIAAWVEQRNAKARIKWMFNTEKACKKLAHAYSGPRQRVIIPVQRHLMSGIERRLPNTRCDARASVVQSLRSSVQS